MREIGSVRIRSIPAPRDSPVREMLQGKKGGTMAKEISSKNLLLYIGIVLVLAGSIVSKGEDMIIVLLGGVFILFLETMEFKTLSHKNSVFIEVILSSSLLLVAIIKLVDSVGKSFTARHLYLMAILLGLVLILLDNLKRWPGKPEG
jgi:hypothetical protein